MIKENMGEDFFEEYVQINEIKQYFLHYKKASNFVVLFLHGGMTEAHLGYKNVLKDRIYSFVYYDQRGTGKTQSMNKSKPHTITLDSLIDDLDETINYIRKVYPNKKLILLGHSRGSLLGMAYLQKHPAKVDAYVGMGQLVNFKAGLKNTMEYCSTLANARDIKKLEVLQNYSESPSPESLKKACLGLEQIQSKYKLAGYKHGSFQLMKMIINSPVFKLSDLLPILLTMKTNANLFPVVGSCDFYSHTAFSIPIYFICGKNDWQAPGTIVAKYYETITAPSKGLYWIENAGHFTNLDNPNACTKVLNEICSSL